MGLELETLELYGAQPIGSEDIPSFVVKSRGPFPSGGGTGLHAEQAAELVDLLFRTLPQATLERLTAEMLRRSACELIVRTRGARIAHALGLCRQALLRRDEDLQERAWDALKEARLELGISDSEDRGTIDVLPDGHVRGALPCGHGIGGIHFEAVSEAVSRTVCGACAKANAAGAAL